MNNSFPNTGQYKIEPVNQPSQNNALTPQAPGPTGQSGMNVQTPQPVSNDTFSKVPSQSSVQPNSAQPPSGTMPPPNDQQYSLPPANNQKKNKKTLVALIGGGLVLAGLLTIGALTLFGGGSSEPEPEPTDSTAISLDWWGAFIKQEAIQPLLDEYATIKPNVTIQYTDLVGEQGNEGDSAISKISQYKNVIDSQLAQTDLVSQASTPAIMSIENTWLGEYAGFSEQVNNRLYPSTSISAEEMRNNFYPFVSEDFVINSSSVYGVPLWVDNLAVIYNKDLVPDTSLPQNNSSFRKRAHELTVFDGDTITIGGFGAGNGSNISFAYEYFNLLLAQNDITILDPSGAVVFQDDPITEEVFDFYKSFQNATDTLDERTWSSDFALDAIELLQEDNAIIVTTSWRLRDILNIIDTNDSINFELGVAPIPSNTNSASDSPNWATYWGNVVPANQSEGRRRAAWEFLEWMSQPEQLEKLHINIEAEHGQFGQLYPRIDMQSILNDSIQSRNQNEQYLLEFNNALPRTESFFAFNGDAIKLAILEMLDASNYDRAIGDAVESINDAVLNRGIGTSSGSE